MKEQVGAFFLKVDASVATVVVGAGGAGASFAVEKLVGFEMARESTVGFAVVALVGAAKYFYEVAVDEIIIHR